MLQLVRCRFETRSATPTHKNTMNLTALRAARYRERSAYFRVRRPMQLEPARSAIACVDGHSVFHRPGDRVAAHPPARRRGRRCRGRPPSTHRGSAETGGLSRCHRSNRDRPISQDHLRGRSVPDSVFVITAYPLGWGALGALRRRRRRKK
jgi:hypothetical protein